MLNGLCLKPSTNKTFFIKGFLPWPTVPIAITLHWLLSPNVTSPPSLCCRDDSMFILPVICLEHPLSIIHFSLIVGTSFAVKHMFASSSEDVSSFQHASKAFLNLACLSLVLFSGQLGLMCPDFLHL